MTSDDVHNAGRRYFYSFNDFTFNVSRRELRQNGRLIELNPQPARLLEILLQSAPEVVTRNTLQDELWGGKATVEFEQSLNTCIAQLRSALGDSARRPEYIITEPKVGYRFLATVEAKASANKPRLQRSVAFAAIGVTAIIAAVGVALFSATQEAPGLLKAREAQIQELVLKARSLRRFGDITAMTESLTAFEDALAQTPQDPAVMAGASLNLAVIAGSDGFPVRATYERADDLAGRAISANAQAVDAYLARGFIALFDRWDVDAARRDFERARKLAPNYALAHVWLATALAADGDTGKAVAASARAVELDPTSWYVLADRCWYLIYAEDYQTALESCAGAVEIAPSSAWSTLGLIEAHRGVGDEAAAASLLRQLATNGVFGAIEIDHDGPPPSFDEAACAIADEVSKRRAGPNFQIAAFYAQCGDFDAAAPWLREAVSGGESFALFYPIDPRFKSFRASEAGAKALVVIEKRPAIPTD